MPERLGGIWRNYLYLRGVRQENRDLKQEIERLRLEQVRLAKMRSRPAACRPCWASRNSSFAKTLAAQVIGSSGSEQSRSVYIDKGTSDGGQATWRSLPLTAWWARCCASFGSSAQVLLIDDQSSGVGAILENSRLQGVLRGTASGEVILEKVMTDEMVEPGEKILTSGGDQIFPKGLPVGYVHEVSPGADLFLKIRVKPAANLGRAGRSAGDYQERGAGSVAGGNKAGARGGHSGAERCRRFRTSRLSIPVNHPAAATPDILAKPPASRTADAEPGCRRQPCRPIRGQPATVKPVTAPKPAPLHRQRRRRRNR